MVQPLFQRPPVVEVPAPGRGHAVINALVEELPAPGSDWPAEQRKAWLDMMDQAFTLAYRSSGLPARSQARLRDKSATRVAKRKTKPKRKAKRPAPKRAGPAFFIDRQNFARRANGDRIMPHDVAGILVDKRGEHGDLATITWADDSTGIPRGLQLDIGIADAEA